MTSPCRHSLEDDHNILGLAMFGQVCINISDKCTFRSFEAIFYNSGAYLPNCCV
jgi:hypothetical protein